MPGVQFSVRDPRRAWIITPTDPRIHFALNCVSKSYPPIGIYTPERIDTQLESATRYFINQDVNFDPETNTLKLSRIFKWFAVDFGGLVGVLEFVQGYLATDQAHLISPENKNFKINFIPYDWGLNRRI